MVWYRHHDASAWTEIFLKIISIYGHCYEAISWAFDIAGAAAGSML